MKITQKQLRKSEITFAFLSWVLGLVAVGFVLLHIAGVIG
jgi:hypothetical protein